MYLQIRISVVNSILPSFFKKGQKNSNYYPEIWHNEIAVLLSTIQRNFIDTEHFFVTN